MLTEVYSRAWHVRFVRAFLSHRNIIMAASSEGGGKDELKTQFVTREGTYKLMTLSEYTRPNRGGFNGQTNAPVKVSFITLNDKMGSEDRICFNLGRELYFYQYKGVRKAADLTKPIDKRAYKGTYPTCHDFNQLTARIDSVMLLVGFTAGQIQLIDPIKKELGKLYNEERQIEKSKVTCIQWIPASPNQFLVAHGSGCLYVYNEELACGVAPPTYQTFKQGEGFAVYTCKTKSTRNPLYRWVIGEGNAINQFSFSPCAKYLAVVSQDGFMRVFDYDSMDLVGSMKSYFGGLLCVCWSPDGKYVVTGGEDDLITIWSFYEKRVVCRGQGHKSWVNTVAFDPFCISTWDEDSGMDVCGSDDDFNHISDGRANHNSNGLLQDSLRASVRSTTSRSSLKSGGTGSVTTYRVGSLSQDTHLCLWDLSEDVLRQPVVRTRTSTIMSQTSTPCISNSSSKFNSMPHHNSISSSHTGVNQNAVDGPVNNHTSHHSSNAPSFTQKFATLALGDRSKDKDHHDGKHGHKRTISMGNKGDKVSLLKSNCVKPVDESIRLLGTAACPRLDEVPLLEPLVCKKIAHERLTDLVFREECIVTACQEGAVSTWARPGKIGLNSVSHTPVSPQQSVGSTAL